MPSAPQHWFVRYKLYHLPLWLVYHFAWWSIGLDSAWVALESIGSVYGIKYLSYVGWQAVGVYVNLYVLIPGLLVRRRYAAYLLALAATVVATASLIVTGYYLIAAVQGVAVAEAFDTEGHPFYYLLTRFALASTVASTTLAMSVKLAKAFLDAQRRQRELEREKLRVELDFLRAQLSPHLLFNTINSIFFLIHRDPDRAAEALAELSHLLRYQLYECNAPQIPIGREIGYLADFVALQRLRQDADVHTCCALPDASAGADLTIAPFLLITFVENAFKHVTRGSGGDHWIEIALTLAGTRLHLEVANTSEPPASPSPGEVGGVGLRNAVRRLELLYPGKHRLTYGYADGVYSVTLTLSLDAAATPRTSPVPSRRTSRLQSPTTV